MYLTLTRIFIGIMCLMPVIGGLTTVANGQENEAIDTAGQIIDRDVYDADQKLIGEVDDIILRRNGKAKKLTVEFGGVLDLGDKLVALDYKPLGFTIYGMVYDIMPGDLKEYVYPYKE